MAPVRDGGGLPGWQLGGEAWSHSSRPLAPCVQLQLAAPGLQANQQPSLSPVSPAKEGMRLNYPGDPFWLEWAAVHAYPPTTLGFLSWKNLPFRSEGCWLVAPLATLSGDSYPPRKETEVLATFAKLRKAQQHKPDIALCLCAAVDPNWCQQLNPAL